MHGGGGHPAAVILHAEAPVQIVRAVRLGAFTGTSMRCNQQLAVGKPSLRCALACLRFLNTAKNGRPG